jgi:deoxycytidylate deaminase
VLNISIDNINDIFAGKVSNPELVFGIVGPIGVNIDNVIDALSSALLDMQYKSHVIHLTKIAKNDRIQIPIDNSSYFNRYDSLIRYGNEFCRLAKTKSALAGVAISQIREIRKSILEARGITDVDKNPEPATGNAYIVRQFKRPEEIELMRLVYGRKFIQLSVFGSASERRKVLMRKIQNHNPVPKSDEQCEKEAIELIEMDNNQKDEPNGQRLSDVFHIGDVFVDGIEKKRTDDTIKRFIRALFGDTHISPTKEEYGLYIATAASFRSVDLSRQVGAAIFSPRGEVITLGCNEVPKASGGTYWADDPTPIARDVELGSDPNHDRKTEILYDLLERMKNAGFLSEELNSKENEQERIEELTKNSQFRESQLMDIIEYGRIIHAEMSAISDAARIGRPTNGATLFCTTFPCHICAKHIVAAGMQRVVFLEPYPKSHAIKLHPDSITFERNDRDSSKVLFEPFIGISPRRYRDLFEKKKRKDENGKAKDWYEGKPAPLIEDRGPSYLTYEANAIFVALKEVFSSYGTKAEP